MAQMVSGSPANPRRIFPFSDSLQVLEQPNFYYTNISSSNTPLPDTMMMPNKVGGNAVENPIMLSRKRMRDEEDIAPSSGRSKEASFCTLPTAKSGLQHANHHHGQGSCSLSSSLGADISVRMQREQHELDLFVLMQMEKIRAELEQKRIRYWANIFQAVEQGMQRVLKFKDEEIARISRRNTALEEKVKSLLMEGQIWKTVAQTNEATVTVLRRDLELVQAREGEGDNGEVDDSMSSCDGDGRKSVVSRGCHGCRKNQISVLALPCRHLCLCSECDSRLQSCPLCMSPKSASIKVQLC